MVINFGWLMEFTSVKDPSASNGLDGCLIRKSDLQQRKSQPQDFCIYFFGADLERKFIKEEEVFKSKNRIEAPITTAAQAKRG